jgi:uncharacterized protein (DUF362 family)
MTTKKDFTDISRRQFNKTILSSALGLTALVHAPSLLFSSAGKSRVVIVRSEKLKRINHVVSKQNIEPKLDHALKRLTGLPSATNAWKSMFSPGEKVGIKLSCLPGKPLSSGYGLVMAIVDGLLACGIKPKDILIWERTIRELKEAGFSSDPPGARIVGTDRFTGHGDGYSDQIEFAGSVGTRFSRIMEKVDALINVPVLKDHDLSGVSISMKNYYGAIYNPNKFHRNNCNPFIAELNTHPLIKNKQRLIVCDATRIQLNNGPAFYPKYALDYGALLVSRDPVALDYVGWQIIETERIKMNLKPLKEVKREPVYIQTAADLKLGNFGEPNIDKIEL